MLSSTDVNCSLNPFSLSIAFAAVVILLKLFNSISPPKKPIYLLDYACYKPKDSQKISPSLMLERFRLYHPTFNTDTFRVFEKMVSSSGVGPATYYPKGMLMEPPMYGRREAMEEAEETVFGVVDALLEKTGVAVEEIGVVVVCCCLFNPVPSLSSMIVRRYKMKESVRVYDLSGMGCTAGLVAMGLCKNLLQVHNNTYALVVTAENITASAYNGRELSMLPPIAVFRLGSAAVLLSNRPSDCQLAKYELIRTSHTHSAQFDRSYKCVYLEEDSQGLVGVNTTKDLLQVASKSIAANLAILGPTILPFSEKLRFLVNRLIIMLHVAPSTKPYRPNFSQACVDHFITHVGGKPVLDGVEKALRFKEIDMEASRMTLYRFGNTSGSSIWYGLAYTEAKGRVKKGHKVWQLGFGSGFKCTSLVWRAIRDVKRCEKFNPWSDEIDEFPVDLNAYFSKESSSSSPGSHLFQLISCTSK